MYSTLGQTLFRTVLCGLVLAVVVQTGFQIKKYASNQNTIARTSEHHDELYFPAMSFCLGFRRERVLKLPWFLLTGDVNDDTFPATKEEADELWAQNDPERRTGTGLCGSATSGNER